jgi:hypothetical protein
MKPVHMTKFGTDKGDCLTACIASLLERDIETLPNFSDFDKEWHYKTVAILQGYGYEAIYIHAEALAREQVGIIVSNCLCVCIFDTGTHEDHAKLGRWTSRYDLEKRTWSFSIDEVFDPNPHPTFECKEMRGVFLIFPSIERKQ